LVQSGDENHRLAFWSGRIKVTKHTKSWNESIDLDRFAQALLVLSTLVSKFTLLGLGWIDLPKPFWFFRPNLWRGRCSDSVFKFIVWIHAIDLAMNHPDNQNGDRHFA
jgi:hypothetical protein